jgi:hypothetical protein
MLAAPRLTMPRFTWVVQRPGELKTLLRIAPERTALLSNAMRYIKIFSAMRVTSPVPSPDRFP